MDALKSTDKETDKYILTGKPQNLKAKGPHALSVQNKPTHSLKVKGFDKAFEICSFINIFSSMKRFHEYFSL